jgi:hypothetical protein
MDHYPSKNRSQIVTVPHLLLRYNDGMRMLFILSLIVPHLFALQTEGYATVGMVSHHFSKNDDGESYNQKHDAYGAEAVFDGRYTLGYLHFINSRDKETDIYAAGYRYDVYGPFGVSIVAGYQKGYCFDGLRSVECTEGMDNSGFAFMPMLYYRNPYFILDVITQGSMVGLKLNIKLF